LLAELFGIWVVMGAGGVKTNVHGGSIGNLPLFWVVVFLL
jgi:hypothetical protein